MGEYMRIMDGLSEPVDDFIIGSDNKRDEITIIV